MDQERWITKGEAVRIIAKMTILPASIGMQQAATAADGPSVQQPAGTKAAQKSPRKLKFDDEEGIWKAVVPPGSMKGEYDSHDPIGLAAGALIKADCSINWVSPDTGKLYCFSSGTSLVYFLSWPKRNANRAWRGWQKLKTPTN